MESNCSTNTSTAFAAAASGAAAPATGLVALYAVAEAAGARRPPRAPTALSLSRVRGRTGKTKVKMSASTKQNSDKHIYGAQATGVHQAFTNGYQRGSIKHSLMDPSRGREEFNTHNVKGWSTHMLVLRAIFCTANRKFVEQSPGQNVHLYNSEGSAKMAKIKNKKNK